MFSIKNCIIFSVYRNKAIDSSHNATKARLNDKDILFKTGIGSYKGTEEACILVPLYEYTEVLDIANTYDQESVLFVQNSIATLFFLKTGEMHYLGTLTEIDEEYANASDAWTFIDNKYYTCFKGWEHV